jgi:hypothetical protein
MILLIVTLWATPYVTLALLLSGALNKSVNQVIAG